MVAGALVAAGALAGCGGSGDARSGAVVRAADSSWVAGQRSLTSLPPYAAIARRSYALGASRQRVYLARIADIAARRVAQRKRQRADILRRYQEQVRRARLRYLAALRRAQRLAAENRRRRAALERERARKLKKYLESLLVKPGLECTLPEVRRTYRCRTGSTPVPRAKPKRR
jgi:hypothetical protein